LDARSVGVAPGLVSVLTEARQPVPSWLRGMAHQGEAKRRDEESAIALGGGSLSTDAAPVEAFDDSRYGSQDFRKTAAPGSWGADRDTSYKGFADDAYGDAAPAKAAVDSALDSDVALSDVGDADEPDARLYEPDDDFVERLQGAADAPPRSSGDSAPLKREPSTELLTVLKDLGCTTWIRPDRRVLDRLASSCFAGLPKGSSGSSKRGNFEDIAHRNKFEYMGLFEFAAVAHLVLPKRQSAPTGLPRVLMVAEKPSIAKAIADALAGPRGPRQTRGVSQALPVYEFVCEHFQGKPCYAVVTSVVGHVFSLGFAEKQDGSKIQDPSAYFDVDVVKREEDSTGKLRIVEHLRAAAAKADALVLWLDCDNEGENIAHEVIGVTRKALPAGENIHRAKFSSITPDALQTAFKTLGRPNELLSRSVDVRQELDLRVGVAITRLLTWRTLSVAKKKFSHNTKVVSYGPCQTPALRFCAERWRQIEAFRPTEYWKVSVQAFRPNSPQMAVKWQHGGGFDDCTDEALATAVVQGANDPDSTLVVTRVETSSHQMKPPNGLNTVKLLVAGSKALGMAPKTVMSVAEKLYSQGLISYPRTETTRYDSGLDVKRALKANVGSSDWGDAASTLLRGKYSDSNLPPRSGNDLGDHPPITPTRCAGRAEVWGGGVWKVYDFICRTFLGSLSDDLELKRTSVTLELRGGPKTETFVLEHVEVEKIGFGNFCPWVLNDVRAHKSPINLRVGDVFNASATLQKLKTRPPRFLQEHELVELMDTHRIGTDASMAAHVTTIVDRGYVALVDETGDAIRPPRKPNPNAPPRPRQIGRYLVPTTLGLGLLDLLSDVDDSQTAAGPAHLARPAIRARIEAEVAQVARGDAAHGNVLGSNLAWFKSRYSELAESLTPDRLAAFAVSLKPAQSQLRAHRSKGYFEQPVQQSGGQAQKAHKSVQENKRSAENAKLKAYGKRSAADHRALYFTAGGGNPDARPQAGHARRPE